MDIRSDGALYLKGFDELQILKQRMQDHHLYVLGLSETRIAGAGSVAVGGGYTLVGGPGDGSVGGTAFLLSPPATLAWQAKGSPCGRALHISLKLDGGEGSNLRTNYAVPSRWVGGLLEPIDTHLVSDLQPWNCFHHRWLQLSRWPHFACTPSPVDPARNSNGDSLLRFCNAFRLKVFKQVVSAWPCTHARLAPPKMG